MLTTPYGATHRYDYARQNFRYLDSKVKLDQVYAYGWVTPTSNELNRYYTGGDEKLHAFIVDNMLQAEFFTGATKHTVLMGVHYQRRKTVVDWTGGGLAPINAFNPVYGNSDIDYYSPTSYLRRLEQTGVYLQDLIEMDKWRFSLGLRQDWVETSDENRRPQENFYRAVGAVRSQGLELEAHMQLTDSLKVLGSYTSTDIEYSKSMISTLSTYTDVIQNRGNSPTQAPRHIASIWADDKFDSAALDGLCLGGGVRYVGYSWADAENTMKVPSYTLLDASVGYDLGKVGLKGVDVRLNTNNLTNESYVASCASLNFCYMGKERNVSATVRYQF